jgi:adenylate kinase
MRCVGSGAATLPVGAVATDVATVGVAGSGDSAISRFLKQAMAHRVHLLEANGDNYRMQDSKRRLKARKG